MAVKDARSVRAAQRSQILDGHRSGGYARKRVSLLATKGVLL
jgi:hypothetical protein